MKHIDKVVTWLDRQGDHIFVVYTYALVTLTLVFIVAGTIAIGIVLGVW